MRWTSCLNPIFQACTCTTGTGSFPEAFYPAEEAATSASPDAGGGLGAGEAPPAAARDGAPPVYPGGLSGGTSVALPPNTAGTQSISVHVM